MRKVPVFLLAVCLTALLVAAPDKRCRWVAHKSVPCQPPP